MFGFPTQKKYIQAPLALIVIMFVLEFLKPMSMDILGLYPNLVFDGEIWRIITGQLLHTNFNHLLLNSAGIVLVWALHGEYYLANHFIKVFLSSLIAIGVCLVIFADYYHYAGLSAVIHTLIVYGAIKDILAKEITGWLILLGMAFKVGYENIYGASDSTIELINASVAVEAHLIGVSIGLLLSIPFVTRLLKLK